MNNSSKFHETESFEGAEKKLSCMPISTVADSEVGQEYCSARDKIGTKGVATAVKHPRYDFCKKKVRHSLHIFARLDLAVYEYSFIILFLIQLLLIVFSIKCIYPVIIKREMVGKGILYSSSVIPDECVDYSFFAQCIPQV